VEARTDVADTVKQTMCLSRQTVEGLRITGKTYCVDAPILSFVYNTCKFAKQSNHFWKYQNTCSVLYLA